MYHFSPLSLFCSQFSQLQVKTTSKGVIGWTVFLQKDVWKPSPSTKVTFELGPQEEEPAMARSGGQIPRLGTASDRRERGLGAEEDT